MSSYLHSVNPGEKKAALKDRNGNGNVVALVRRTRKGERLVVGGEAVGGAGINGSDYYTLREGADGVLYDDCGDYRNRGFKFNRLNKAAIESGEESAYACKHIGFALEHAAEMIARGVAMDSEMILYRPEVLVRHAQRRLAVAARKAEQAARRTA